MAIQPIDLQTLFTQVDKVGKNVANAKEGVEFHTAIQNIQIQKKTEEQVQTVRESRNLEEGAQRINDRNAKKKQGESSPETREKETGSAEDAESRETLLTIRDPDLGNHIDLSG
jgi:hypothetical protein